MTGIHTPAIPKGSLVPSQLLLTTQPCPVNPEREKPPRRAAVGRREVRSWAMEPGAMLPASAEYGGPPSTQGAQLGGSCCLTHLQAAGGQWDAAGRPQGCCLRS